MADQNQSQTDDLENLDPDVSAENPDASQSDASPAPQSDTDSRIAALEAQVNREKERNQLLEQSLRIQERFLQNQDGTKPRTSEARPEVMDKDLEVLDKALDPVLGRRFKERLEPLQQTVATALEDNDALRFEMFLTRNHPELLDDEDQYNAAVQQVQQVRDAARTRGINISRVDAFVFNEGLKGTREKQKTRKQARTRAATSETRRQAEVRAASATGATAPAPRASANAAIQDIRAKAARGERLNSEERGKYAEWIGSTEF